MTPRENALALLYAAIRSPRGIRVPFSNATFDQVLGVFRYALKLRADPILADLILCRPPEDVPEIWLVRKTPDVRGEPSDASGN